MSFPKAAKIDVMSKIYKTFSLTDEVRDKVQNVVQDLSANGHLLSKADIKDIIERRHGDMAAAAQDSDEGPSSSVARRGPSIDAIDLDDDKLGVTIEFINGNEKHEQIEGNLQDLDKRITDLEYNMYHLHQKMKEPHLHQKRFKLKQTVIIEDVEAEGSMQNACGTKPKQLLPCELSADEFEVSSDSDDNEIDDSVDYAEIERHTNAINMQNMSSTTLLLNHRLDYIDFHPIDFLRVPPHITPVNPLSRFID